MKMIFIFLTIFFSQVCLANIDRKGNGGDLVALEFIETAREVLKTMREHRYSEIDLSLLKKSIDTTEIEVTDQALSLNGVPKSAINYPSEKRIVLSRRAWKEAQNKLSKMTLSLHEYLGIMGLEDSRYEISMKAIKLYGSSVVRCESRFMYRSGTRVLIGDVEGEVTLDLSSENVYSWEDDLRSYFLQAGEASPGGRYVIFTVNELKQYNPLEIRSALDMVDPQFYMKMPVETNLIRHGGKVLFVLIECN